jgi:sterol desaturase/sphingolipid hydroxylase (fatty acid hydroxylase superfamily)
MLHGYHHDYPNDPGRLVAPPVLSWPIAICTFIVQLSLFGSWSMPLFAGTCLGYLGYDWVHYYTHHARPKTKVGKFIRRFHLEHHYRNALEQYGISSPLWDLVFRTWPHRNR